jgi:RNA polymerase sigma-70 factor (ECF subfamily)
MAVDVAPSRVQPFQLVSSLKDMGVQLLEAERERTDRDLVAGFLAGGELEFRTLYRRHTPRIRAVAMRFMGGEAADADDVVQETWLRACRALAGFRWEAALSSWLVGVTIRVAAEALRRRSPAAPDDAADRPARSVPAGLRLDLERAIALLPPQQRTIVVLHDIEGYTHEEIAEMLGTVPGTSRSNLARARATLRERLRA